MQQSWIICPFCGEGKIMSYSAHTVVRGLPCFCKICKRELTINFEISALPVMKDEMIFANTRRYRVNEI